MRRKHFRRNEPIKFMAKSCNSDSSGLQKAGEKDSHLLLYRHEKQQQQQQQPNETETKINVVQGHRRMYNKTKNSFAYVRRSRRFSAISFDNRRSTAKNIV